MSDDYSVDVYIYLDAMSHLNRHRIELEAEVAKNHLLHEELAGTTQPVLKPQATAETSTDSSMVASTRTPSDVTPSDVNAEAGKLELGASDSRLQDGGKSEAQPASGTDIVPSQGISLEDKEAQLEARVAQLRRQAEELHSEVGRWRACHSTSIATQVVRELRGEPTWTPPDLKHQRIVASPYGQPQASHSLHRHHT
eukprot:gnl/MRDRNA2_/MRDRNA2_58482_c0_seq1.p1 gnl/MRDRNA2_/MRDRNA2_58482_c0~~gnl/MRDRNA2_/MRDRNA2_58482_c0_seq1.p1  ORF type:complete len:197 (+),score=37.22 gnl/MRDRNA2_/MRDRNA2_58482_c0_seq1:118-708(+)